MPFTKMSFMHLKEILRKILIALHIDATQNLRYDRLTDKIIVNHLQADSNCVDVGCHKGEILERMLQCSPSGHHFAFEPLPDLYASLQSRFGSKAEIFPYALSDMSGDKITFNRVKNAPAYSGLRQRAYDDLPHAEVECIEVDVRRMDDVIPANMPIDFIKIDVEGGDYHVLKGAERIIKENHPLVIFEFGIGGADHYGITPTAMYQLMVGQYNYHIYTLDNYVKGRKALSESEFQTLYNDASEYYFIATAE
jgi:FkbM family methyltransferase